MSPYQAFTSEGPKEELFEQIRARDYPDRPTRLGSIFLFPTMERAEVANAEWWNSGRGLADAMAAETELPADEDIVHLALGQLSKAGLLEGPQEGFEQKISRRQIIQRLSLASSLTVLLPMVGTIVAPSSAMAQPGPPSPTPNGPTLAPGND